MKELKVCAIEGCNGELQIQKIGKSTVLYKCKTCGTTQGYTEGVGKFVVVGVYR